MNVRLRHALPRLCFWRRPGWHLYIEFHHWCCGKSRGEGWDGNAEWRTGVSWHLGWIGIEYTWVTPEKRGQKA